MTSKIDLVKELKISQSERFGQFIAKIEIISKLQDLCLQCTGITEPLNNLKSTSILKKDSALGAF